MLSFFKSRAEKDREIARLRLALSLTSAALKELIEKVNLSVATKVDAKDEVVLAAYDEGIRDAAKIAEDCAAPSFLSDGRVEPSYRDFEIVDAVKSKIVDEILLRIAFKKK
ncbi:hypothetical protein UFOVP1414_22 [uncultured Caudovirales phage]|uniref:Uncharacterized protein n=1 Tax=uncultured Caudovirales phage TaxID=2100421 RepID=A0A6J5M844_9CAUD|nr:hypothetical protein UFOVP442_55 [uncultured Caudovirales phage]CAB4211795.1 hypothetical protein UFOVP1414_22 [uncultured Caudovirales phage]